MTSAAALALLTLTRAHPTGLPFALNLPWIGLLLIAAGIAWRRRTRRPTRMPDATPYAVERARLLYGLSHISCFVASEGKQALPIPGGVIAYEVRGRVAVAVGDPLTEPARRVDAIAYFASMCKRTGLVASFFQTDSALRDAYCKAGLRVMKFSEEAIVETDRFDLGSPGRSNARHELARARRAGLTVDVLDWPGPEDCIWRSLSEVSASWLSSHGGSEMGFSLGRFAEVVDVRGWITVARDDTGRVHGFCTWLRMGADGSGLDMMRRGTGSAPGAMDLCLVAGVHEAQRRGLHRVSLGSVPLRDSLGDACEPLPARLMRSFVYERGFGGYRYAKLAHFKSNYATQWVSRDVALPRGPACLAAIAALASLHRNPGTSAMPTGSIEVAPEARSARVLAHR
ncbi:MAG TPA: DUF2156 domain-containing protein [Candidatus Acidoferrales bacterium]|nr:DUF2156 domain-containing protein [Candidatus Acidoferrales bacterium]